MCNENQLLLHKKKYAMSVFILQKQLKSWEQ